MHAFGCHVVICMSIVPSYLYLVHEHAVFMPKMGNSQGGMCLTHSFPIYNATA